MIQRMISFNSPTPIINPKHLDTTHQNVSKIDNVDNVVPILNTLKQNEIRCIDNVIDEITNSMNDAHFNQINKFVDQSNNYTTLNHLG